MSPEGYPDRASKKPRSNQVNVRLSAVDYEILEAGAFLEGVSLAEFARRQIICFLQKQAPHIRSRIEAEHLQDTEPFTTALKALNELSPPATGINDKPQA